MSRFCRNFQPFQVNIIPVKTRPCRNSSCGTIFVLNHVFQKKYKQLWSYEVFYISEILNSTPTTYKIKDFNKETIKGCFYENELQIVDKSSNIYAVERIIRRRQYRGRAQYLVKFQGYPDSFNSWIDQTDLFDI